MKRASRGVTYDVRYILGSVVHDASSAGVHINLITNLQISNEVDGCQGNATTRHSIPVKIFHSLQKTLTIFPGIRLRVYCNVSCEAYLLTRQPLLPIKKRESEVILCIDNVSKMIWFSLVFLNLYLSCMAKLCGRVMKLFVGSQSHN